jgi:hypothetical protein
MPKPDTEGRYDILRLQLRGKAVAPDVDLLQLARDLPGLVGADLANIINEAQLHGEGGGGGSAAARVVCWQQQQGGQNSGNSLDRSSGIDMLCRLLQHQMERQNPACAGLQAFWHLPQQQWNASCYVVVHPLAVLALILDGCACVCPLPCSPVPAAVRAGRTELTKRDIYAGVDRFTQGELRPALPTSSSRLPLLCFAAREVSLLQC